MSNLPNLKLSPWGYLPVAEVIAHLAEGEPIPAETTVFDTATGKFKTIHWHRSGVFEEHLGFSPRNYREATKNIQPSQLTKPATLKPAKKPAEKKPLLSTPEPPKPALEEERPEYKELLARADLAGQAIDYAQQEIEAVAIGLRRLGALWERDCLAFG